MMGEGHGFFNVNGVCGFSSSWLGSCEIWEKEQKEKAGGSWLYYPFL